jgi:hypothetical protein
VLVQHEKPIKFSQCELPSIVAAISIELFMQISTLPLLIELQKVFFGVGGSLTVMKFGWGNFSGSLSIGV